MIQPPNTTQQTPAGARLAALAAYVNDHASMRTALVGDADENLDVVGRPNFVYMRLDGPDAERVEVRVSVVRPAVNDRVLVMREQPTKTAGWRLVFWLTRPTDPSAPHAPILDGA